MGEEHPERSGASLEAGQETSEQEPRFFRGVAAVPRRSATAGAGENGSPADTGELPPAVLAPVGRNYPAARLMPRGQRWRTLRRGGGWTMAGLWIAVVCWGIWVVSLRGQGGSDLIGPAFTLGLVLGTGAIVFTVSRLLGRMVLEGWLGRARHSAWASHVMVFLLLVIGAVAFLQQTWWVVSAWNWVADALT